MTRPHLNEQEKETIKVLAADGQSPSKISKQVKRSPHTVAKFLAEPEVERQVQDEKAVLAEKYRGKALRILDSINDSDISKSSLQQKSISSGILLDKSLLLAGEMPSINVTALLDAVNAIRALRDAGNPMPSSPYKEMRAAGTSRAQLPSAAEPQQLEETP